MYAPLNPAYRRNRLPRQEHHPQKQKLQAPAVGYGRAGKIQIAHPQLFEGCKMCVDCGGRHQQELPEQR